uniref:Uncharacterized protein n=1 Tax=Lepeophtheirus salmonis TaxID=72036 RepID=A0A0K2VD93_LEPSM
MSFTSRTLYISWILYETILSDGDTCVK